MAAPNKTLEEIYASNPVNEISGDDLFYMVRDGVDVSVKGGDVISQLAGMSLDVRNFGAIGNGIADDTTSIQAALNAGNIYIPSGTWLISSHLICPSNREIEASPTAIIKRAPQTIDPGEPALISNSDEVGGNSNITIDGGIWDADGDNQTNSDLPTRVQSSLRFIKVAGLVIKNLTIKDPISLSIQTSTVNRLVVENIYFDQTPSDAGHENDGLHINGPSADIFISNLHGQTDDDFLALNAYDVNGFGPTTGTIQRVIVNGLTSNSCRNLIRILSAQGALVSDVQITNIKGRCYNSGIIVDDYSQGGSQSVKNVQITNAILGLYNETFSAAGLPVIRLATNIDGLTLTNFTRDQSDTTGKTMVVIQGAFTFNAIAFNNLTHQGTTAGLIFDITPPAVVGRLSVDGFTVKCTATIIGFNIGNNFLTSSLPIHSLELANVDFIGNSSSRLMQLGSGTLRPVIGTLQLRGVSMDGFETIIADVGGVGYEVTNLSLNGVAAKNGNTGISLANGSGTIGTLSVTDCQFDTLSYGPFYCANSTIVSRVAIANSLFKDLSVGLSFGQTGAKCRVQTTGLRITNVATMNGLSTIHSLRSLDFAVAKTALTPDLNDIIIDTTAGISRWNGTTWVNP